MAQDATELFVGLTGKIMVANKGTTAPVDADAAWPVGWTDLGLTTDDGVSITPGKDVEEIRAWQLLYPARMLVTTRSLEVGFALEQWNSDTLPFVFGGGQVVAATPPATGYRYEPPTGRALVEKALGVEVVDGSKVSRLIIPRGFVSDNDDINLNQSDNANLPLTFAILGDVGVLPFYIVSNDPAWAA